MTKVRCRQYNSYGNYRPSLVANNSTFYQELLQTTLGQHFSLNIETVVDGLQLVDILLSLIHMCSWQWG